jgi:HEAT repeat protein
VRSLKDVHGRLPGASGRKWRIRAPHIRPKARRGATNATSITYRNDTDSAKTGVIVALGALGDRRAIEPLEGMLKAEKNEIVRQQIEQSLQRLRAVQPDKQ